MKGDLTGIVGAREPRDGAQYLAEHGFAFGYNAIGIPIAAGCCIQPWTPAVAHAGRALMSLSLICHYQRCDSGENSTMVTRRRFVEAWAPGCCCQPAAGRCSARAAAELIGPSFDHRRHAAGEPDRRRSQPSRSTGRSAPTLRMRQGDESRFASPTNCASELRSWHGLIVPADMDGVPGLSFRRHRAGHHVHYRYRVNQSGTYWYHSALASRAGGSVRRWSSSGAAASATRPTGMCCCPTGPITIRHVHATLKRQSGYYSFGKRTAAITATTCGHADSRTLAERRRPMRMDATDLADVSG